MNPQIPRAIVGALIFDKQGRIFLMRSSGKFGNQWIVPGGKVDFGETLTNALQREIREETNIAISDIKFTGVSELVEPQRHFIFLEFTALAHSIDEVRLNQEATEYGWFAKEELAKLDIAAPTLRFIREHGTVIS